MSRLRVIFDVAPSDIVMTLCCSVEVHVLRLKTFARRKKCLLRSSFKTKH